MKGLARHPRPPWVGGALWFRPIFLAVFACLLLQIFVPSAEAAFGFRKPITIDNTKVSGSAGLIGFPVLVSFTDLDLRTTANGGKVENANGFDIVFRQGCTVANLDHEIEAYDPVTGTFVAWVRILVLSYNTDTLIEMYYGDATIVSSQENVAGVWNSNYRAVWHLKEDPADPAPQFLDSTSNPNEGSASSLLTANQVPGKIDGSLEFDDTNERHVNVPDDPTLRIPADITASAWVKTTDADADVGVIVSKWGPIGSRNYWFGKVNASDLDFFVDDTQSVIVPLGLITDGFWHHVVGVADSTAGLLRIYVDGLLRNSAPYTGSTQMGTRELHIGNSSDIISFQEWNGGIDEVRVSDVPRSADWIQTEYNNQDDPSTFYSVGPELSGADCVINYRSIGTAPDYTVGTVNATNGSALVTGTGTAWRTANRGRGDWIIIDGGNYTISSVDSELQLTLTAPFTGTTGSYPTDIRRHFTTLQQWEDCISFAGCPGGYPFPPSSASLVADNRSEVGITYKDSVFTTGTTRMLRIDGSITDATHNIRLTAAPGNGHNGTAGTGVVLDGGGTIHTGIDVGDDFTVIEWLELKRFYATSPGGAKAVLPGATGIVLESLLIHDFFTTDITANGIQPANTGVSSTTVRNCIIYDGDFSGIQVNHAGASMTVENCTIYGMNDPVGRGVRLANGTMVVTNTISMGNVGEDFRDETAGNMTGSHNMSNDATAFSVFASDPNAIIGATSANEFVDDTFATADLHLKLGAEAIDKGTDLSPAFVIDIDAQIRPWGVEWELGADERPTANSCPVTQQAWFDQDWLFRKAVVVQSSQVTAVLTGFPVLINLASDTELAADAQPDGDDIVFTLSDGVTKLSHEIEKFVGATGELVAWVKVPYLSSGADTTIYMYYGNGTVGNQEDVASVWGANYVGVWHLNQDPTVPNPVIDSTSYPNNALGSAADHTPADLVSGKIGLAINFGPTTTGRFLKVTDVTDLEPATYTLEAWVRPDAQDAGNWHYILTKSAALVPSYALLLDPVDAVSCGGPCGDDFGAVLSKVGAAAGDGIGATSVPMSSWTYLVGTFDPAGSNLFEIYIDGTRTSSGQSLPIFYEGAAFCIGRDCGGLGFDGLIDEARVSRVRRSADWIQTQYNNQNSPSTFYTVCSATTDVELVSFEAKGLDGAVELRWETGSELNNLGFHLYRSPTDDGPHEQITASVIPGLGSSPVGAKYSYRDTGLTNGVTYYYQLEDIETTGETDFHGPVSATPTASASGGGDDTDSGGSASNEAASTSLITYGDPSANSFRVVQRDNASAVLELVTEGFYAEPLEDGSVRLEVPGFESLAELTAPGVPVKRTWVEAVAGRKVEIVSVRAGGVQAFTSLRPSGAEPPELVATPEGMVRVAQRRRRAKKAFRTDGLNPSSAARIVSVGFQGEDKKALVELAPLRWDGTNGQLLLARRLLVRVSFRGREPSERILADGVRGRRYARKRSHDQRTVVARLGTTERGLHSVRYEDVMRGRRGVRAKTLRLSRQGETVAFHLEPHGNRFKPATTLYFLSEGASINQYGREAVYELEVGHSGDAGESMPEISAAPSGEPTRVYWHRAEWEENRYYQAALLEAPDLWLWDLLFAPVVKSYPFEVSALALSAPSEASHLSVWLQGVSDFRANPDHHVRVSVNGSLVAEVSWDGKQANKIDVDLLPGLLQEGDNVLELENVGDTEAAYSMVMLDRYALEYPRVALTGDGRLRGRFRESGAAELSGLVAGTHVLDVSDAQPRWLVDTEVGTDGLLRFRAESGRSYLAVSPEAIYHPAVTKPRASRLKNTRNRADYLVIGPEAFLRAAIPLLELRQSEGLKVKAVSIDEVYSEFGFGEPTPEAVKDFLSYAYHHWRQPSPRYVLLLGDATFDFKDHLQTGVTNQVPPRMVKTSYLWTASDPSYAAVNGEDILPDFSIGRLPAATVEQVQAMVEKIVAYETGEAGLDRSAVVLVADNPDRAGNFEADADALAATVLASKNPQKIYLSRLGTTATRNAIVQRFDEGASLMSYLGHGGIHLWAAENFFNRRDVASLGLQSQQPLLLTMNCLNGYFHFPYFNSLAEELVKAKEKGAIAAFSPSGLSLNGPAHRYHQALLQELFSGRYQRLGDAVLAAQAAYADSGVFPELLSIYHLLGDPALRLK